MAFRNTFSITKCGTVAGMITFISCCSKIALLSEEACRAAMNAALSTAVFASIAVYSRAMGELLAFHNAVYVK